MIEDTPSNSIPPEWLAAYADRELDEPARRRVERWLAEHPEALTDLEDQECFSRGGDCLASAAPPIPTGAEWDKVFAGIVQAVAPKPVPARRHYRIVVKSTSMAAVLALTLLAIDWLTSIPAPDPKALLVETPTNASTVAKDDGDDAVYQVANADEVELIQFPEAASALVVVGRHPMQDVPLLLASAADVQVLNYGPDDRGNPADFEPASGADAAILWPPSPKR